MGSYIGYYSIEHRLPGARDISESFGNGEANRMRHAETLEVTRKGQAEREVRTFSVAPAPAHR